MKTNFNNLLEETIKNVRNDRDQADSLLKDLISYIAQGQERHQAHGLILAKYLETLQRSNEQLVKLTSMLKKENDDNNEFTDDDRNRIFEELNGISKSVDKKKKK